MGRFSNKIRDLFLLGGTANDLAEECRVHGDTNVELLLEEELISEEEVGQLTEQTHVESVRVLGEAFMNMSSDEKEKYINVIKRTD